jgi:hypothetical protein
VSDATRLECISDRHAPEARSAARSLAKYHPPIVCGSAYLQQLR